MDHIRRVYVAGVGYMCYLTETLTKASNKHSLNKNSRVQVDAAEILPSKDFAQLDKVEIDGEENTLAPRIMLVQATRVNTKSKQALPVETLSQGALKTEPLKIGSESGVSKKEISVANYARFNNTLHTYVTPPSVEAKDLESNRSIDINYSLNLKIGFSDLKTLDLTKLVTDKDDPLEVLVVGKEILTTPGYQEILLESEPTTGVVVSPIKAIIIIRGQNKDKVNSLAASIRNIRPYSVYKGIGLRLQEEPLTIKVVVKNKQKG